MNLRWPGEGPVARRVTGGLVTCLVAGCLLVGCSSARSDLGTSDSPCFRALPAASEAIHHRGALAGVQLFTLASLHRRTPQLYSALDSSAQPTGQVCVIEYTGSFAESSVSRPFGSPSGRLAVVVLQAPSNRLIGTVILDHPPLPFGHAHAG
jgi:hypothetical protein